MNKKKFKIANIVLDGRVGGPQRRIVQVAQHLLEQGWETVLVFPYMGDELPQYATQNGISYLCVPLSRIRLENILVQLIRYVSRLPFETWQLKTALKNHQIDIVHANGLYNVQAVLAAKLAGLPLVWHINDNSPLPPWSYRIARTTLGWLAEIRVYSSPPVRDMCDDYDDERTAILYPPVDLEKFDPKKLKPSGIETKIPALQRQGNEVLLLAVSNVNWVKGYEFLLDALSNLQDMLVGWRLVVIGAILQTQRPYFASLSNQVKTLGLEEKVVFAGFTDDVAEALSVADVFVMSSTAESGPMVLLEALAMGKPVVTTDVGIAKEVINHEENGLIVPPRDVPALAQALRKIILDEKLRQDFANQARRSVAKKFSVPHVTAEHITVYQKIVNTASNRFNLI
ncbi:MAG: glycosyltransferase family 4 protein [Coleofasciculus sp. C1-SOL-03]|uniref:glycosyltransferase family 4 protein n=1 Tax=Coleofasciculus sp. C1-SOL-03 TaxID=3069522 RepID=UPI003303A03F